MLITSQLCRLLLLSFLTFFFPPNKKLWHHTLIYISTHIYIFFIILFWLTLWFILFFPYSCSNFVTLFNCEAMCCFSVTCSKNYSDLTQWQKLIGFTFFSYGYVSTSLWICHGDRNIPSNPAPSRILISELILGLNSIHSRKMFI